MEKKMPMPSVKDTCREAEENTRKTHGDKMPKGK